MLQANPVQHIQGIACGFLYNLSGDLSTGIKHQLSAKHAYDGVQET
jgi:hypothetical protein